MNARKVFPSRVEDEWIGKTFLAWMTMTRQGKHHTVRSDLTGLTLLIITTKQSVTFYGRMYHKVQYHTPIPSHVPVKVNTITCAGKGFTVVKWGHTEGIEREKTSSQNSQGIALNFWIHFSHSNLRVEYNWRAIPAKYKFPHILI